MESKRAGKLESSEGTFSIALFASYFVIAIGYNLGFQTVFFAGLFLLGIGVTGRGIVRFIITKENDFPRKKLAIFSDYYIAVFQTIFGLLILAGTVAEIFSNYISSGEFWRTVTSNISPLLIFLFIGIFFTVSGLSLMGSVEKSEQKTLKNSLQNFLEILQGIVPFIFGLILIALFILVTFFR